MRNGSVLVGFANVLLFVAGSTLLFAGTKAIFFENIGIAVPALTSALVFILAATVDRFESLKGLGIEAKTRQLNQTLNEAEETLSRLREVAELSGAALITLNSQIGRWNAVPSPEDSYRLAQRVIRILEALGSTRKAIHQSLEPWLSVFIFDLMRSILRPIERALSDRQNELRKMQIVNGATLTAEEQVQLTRELNAIREYQEQQLCRLPNVPISERSAAMIRLIDSAPIDNDTLKQEVRHKAESFAVDIESLLRDLCLSDSSSWFHEINSDRSSST